MKIIPSLKGLSNPNIVITRNNWIGDFCFVDIYRFKANNKEQKRHLMHSDTVAVFHIKYHSKR